MFRKFKKLFAAALAVALVILACPAAYAENEEDKSDNAESGAPSGGSMSLNEREIDALDNRCRGYGQGHERGADNRPTGALMFNGEYEAYDGYAIFPSDKEICLTFDQGYENGYTEKILDTLKEKDVKAVFFITGDYAKRNKELVNRMICEGHIIGNHGMKHASLPKLGFSEAESEIMDLHDYVKSEYNYEMKYFRPPCGEYSEKSIAICQRLGYKTLFWSFAYVDWNVNDQPDKESSLKKIADSAHGGGIYLLHSVSSTNAAILGDAIDCFREKGFVLALPNI